MRNRTSKQNGSNNNNIVNSRRIDMEGLDRLKKNEAHLTGAYIRNLVKQLSNSRTKEPMSSKIVDGEERSESLQSIAKCREKIDENRPLQNQPKKQVRRRLHTSRPYQERLLNMAEARREIVTALKFHRASMKQAQEQKKQQEQYRNHILSIDSTERFESKIIPRIEHSNSANFSGYMNLPFQSFSAPITVPNPSSWASSSSPSSIAPVSTIDNLDISLPDQISGFNLNLQSYQNFETMFYNHNSNNNPLTYTSSSTSSTSPFEEIPPLNFSPHINYVSETSSSSSLFHPLMGDEEIAKIKSIGDQHGVEWNDTLNLVNSAWWLKVLKTMEVKHEGRRIEYGDQGFHFNDGMEISDWLLDYSVENPNESCSLKSHLDGGYTEPFLQESSLPCLNMAEIKGKEDEWFSS